jgi:hypoxanthine phosphoribosyltransferase
MSLEIVLSHEDIINKVKEIADNLDREYKGKNPLVIGIMKGSLYFLADLTQNMTIPVEIDLMCLSSYGNSKKSGAVKIVKDLDMDITNRHVIVLEDIIDTGKTLEFLKHYFLEKDAASVKTISIFEKPSSSIINFTADLVGFKLPDEFLVGYGLDYAQKYRNLKDVCILGEE